MTGITENMSRFDDNPLHTDLWHVLNDAIS